MLTPDYYSKRNAAHQGFEGKIQLLENMLWFQQLVFLIRTGTKVALPPWKHNFAQSY